MKKLNIYLNNKCLLSNNWLIMVFIATALVLSSCAGAKSVRISDSYKKKALAAKTKEPKENNTDLDNKLKQFEEAVIKSKSAEKSSQTENDSDEPAETQKMHLPTLKEQLNSLAEEQAVTRNKVNTLQNDVLDVKYELAEIKQALIKSGQIKAHQVVTGPAEESDLAQSEINVPPSGAVIVSDENLSKSKPAKPAAAKPQAAPQKPAATKPVVKKSKPAIPAAKQVNAVYSAPIQPDKKAQAAAVTPEDKTEMTDILRSFNQQDYNGTIIAINSLMKTNKNAELAAECNYLLGESYLHLKDYPRAIDNFNKALKNPRSAKKDESQAKLAESLVKNGQVDAGRQAYQMLITKYPTSKAVPRAKKMLQQL